jgi:hypothetical protein
MNLVIRLAPTTAFCLLTTVASAQQRPPVAPHVQAPAAHVQQPAGAQAQPHAPAKAGPGAQVAQGAKAAAPAPPVLKATAIAWAKERGFPVREIEVGPPERRVTRLFVPITSETWPSFVDTFGSGPKRLMLKLKGQGDNHLMPVIDGDAFLWGRSVRKMGYDNMYGMGIMGQYGPEAPAMVVELDDAESQHVRQWFTHRADANDALWGQACGHGCMDFIGNIEVAPAADGTNTLRAIGTPEIAQANGGNHYGGVKGGSSTKVPMGKKLFDILGIARSKDGKNITYNMIHAGSDKVQVVGIPVGPDAGGGQTERRVIREDGRVFVRDVKLTGAAIERFERMTDAELLGPVPPQGVAGVVRPVN